MYNLYLGDELFPLLTRVEGEDHVMEILQPDSLKNNFGGSESRLTGSNPQENPFPN